MQQCSQKGGLASGQTVRQRQMRLQGCTDWASRLQTYFICARDRAPSLGDRSFGLNPV